MMQYPRLPMKHLPDPMPTKLLRYTKVHPVYGLFEQLMYSFADAFEGSPRAACGYPGLESFVGYGAECLALVILW